MNVAYRDVQMSMNEPLMLKQEVNFKNIFIYCA